MNLGGLGMLLGILGRASLVIRKIATFNSSLAPLLPDLHPLFESDLEESFEELVEKAQARVGKPPSIQEGRPRRILHPPGLTDSFLNNRDQAPQGFLDLPGLLFRGLWARSRI